MSLSSELIELSQHLQQEHLFVSTEREQLQRLYHTVTLLSEKLFHNAWMARQQKNNLQQYLDQGSNAVENVEIYGTNNQLESTNFVDSYKLFSYHDTKYGELFKFLYENPLVLASIICVADRLALQSVPKMISLMVSSIYGNCIFQEDEHAVLQLLKALLDNQIANSDNPRRLMRRQNTPFSLIYKYLTENLFSARLFLTAALYDPIMKLLMEDEWFFDIDPDKAFVRFPPAEKLKRFGEAGTAENAQKQAQYRSYIVDKLVFLSLRFINFIKASIHCFPPSLGWLVSQVYRILTERGQVSMQEVRASCADLVFALFICPAICDPEPHGITSDVPISHIARHNLMQMAQIIQVLAISQFDEIDPKVRDLYGRFEKGCMSSVLDMFLEGPWEDITEQIVSTRQVHGTGLKRSAVLLMSADVRNMIGFLRNTAYLLDDKMTHKKILLQLLSSLPADMPPSATDNLSLPGGSGVITPNSGLTDSPGTPTAERKIFSKNKVPKKKKSITTAPQLEDLLADSNEDNKLGDVLVISIYPPEDCPGMLTEKKVLTSLIDTESKKTTPLSTKAQPDSVVTSQTPPNPEIQEKRTRFSLSHDQESIGNASDYQEVISEAASSHSVEDENEQEGDNLSDMMSANVSGRGSPSISGRDTPLSQAGSVEENPAAAQLPVPVPETVRKENRVDVTERFGKFEIKAELAMERDECKSTVSDTWSTDVLASDSEPPEQNQVDRLEEVAEEISRPILLGSEPISEISETASDAWSTDVLASDTDEKHSELLRDLEQDLIVGDQNEGDGSIIQDEGEDNSELDQQLGAVGGSGQLVSDVCEPFSFVFPDTHSKSSVEDSDRNGKKISTIVHHFQSGPNLQLPIIHRAPSQSLKHAEGRVMAVLSAIETGPPSQPTTTFLPTSGAKSKTQDKKSARGNNDDQFGDFQPVTSVNNPNANAAGGRRKSRDKWPWNKSSKNNTDMNVSVELPASATSSSNRNGRTSSHDSGIDIWVSTNGQMSGSSSASALMTTRSSLDSSLKQLHPTPLPGRSSLDSNLQRLYSVGGLASSSDSAYISPNSSLDINTPPLEISNSLFHFKSSTAAKKSVSQIPLADDPTSSASHDSQKKHDFTEVDKYKHEDSIPQIDVINILKKISNLENDEDLVNFSEVSNIGEHQISSLNERRLSVAMNEPFDPFSLPSDHQNFGLNKVSTTTADDPTLKISQIFSAISKEKGKPDPELSAPHRKESSGSIVSSSSFKLNATETPSKEASPDNISIVSEDKDLAEGDKQKRTISGGIFRTMKDKFHKGIKRKNTKFDKDLDSSEIDNTVKQDAQGNSASTLSHQESTDDILAKYRTPKKTTSKSSNITNNNNITSINSSSKVDSTDGRINCSCSDTQAVIDDTPQILDLDHPETCPGFVDAKRKLRLVLSTGDVFFGIGQAQSCSPREGLSSHDNELINLLTAQLAEAVNLQNKDLIAQLYEVIRCIKMFDAEGCRKLLDSMKEDYCQRGGYIAYLVRCHQGLLVTRHQLQRLLNRINREKEICSKHLTNICARNFLEKREKRMWKFIADFQKLSLSDEKIDLVEQFLQSLYQEMSSDNLWKAATDCQIEDGRLAIERLLMSRIYTHAMFPNGDGDIMRDQLLHEHLRKLAKIISPSHKDLRIPRMYHLECPWPAAQKEIYMINAYRTPKDKLQCVLRCSQTIMNLLSMANEKSVPAADDFMPVLIFVLIKANPFGLLSTIQYVNSFYEKRLQGEEQYWWLQLTSAVEFIKTMEYTS
ncbi:GTPase-activating protein and VPS9 domain-containing protein 1 [Bulinus truncatus]|nr:GTPase-activating protein and VPS9 domain-containing protein 1 [Bulinus truncatus]